MKIHEELLKDKVFLKEHALKIAIYSCSSPKHFKALMQCFLSDNYRLAQRAAWCVSWATKKNPAFIQPYIKDLVKQLPRKDVHDAVIRNSVRILQQIEIPATLHGELMNNCFAFIESPSTPVAIKAFSLTTLFNLSKTYPEIKNELRLVIEERWNNETAAFKSRAKQILKKI
ncbi:MAG: hypothetical protein JO072_05165 [Parafilimonas sp.]|nr:hypothetical protein [Parafilimonas sp.]